MGAKSSSVLGGPRIFRRYQYQSTTSALESAACGTFRSRSAVHPQSAALRAEVFFAISSLFVLGSMLAKLANSAKTGISLPACLMGFRPGDTGRHSAKLKEERSIRHFHGTFPLLAQHNPNSVRPATGKSDALNRHERGAGATPTDARGTPRFMQLDATNRAKLSSRTPRSTPCPPRPAAARSR